LSHLAEGKAQRNIENMAAATVKAGGIRETRGQATVPFILIQKNF
jgi:hypothetical protein